MKKFQGIFTVMMTAYDADGGIDRRGMAAMTRYLVDSGVHGLVVLGSNGECPYLTHGLQKAVIDAVVAECQGRVPVIVGINERGTEDAIAMARYARSAGADGALAALHLFYALDEDAVLAHYEKLCEAVDMPFLYYNFPGNSHLLLTPEQIARIASIPNMVGAKETIFDVDEVRGLVDATDDDFSVFTGMCLNLTQTMEVGACGAICPLPNVMPHKAVLLYESLSEGNREIAAPLQADFYTVGPLIAGSPTPHALIKEAMRQLGHDIRVEVKSPLPQLTTQQVSHVHNTLVAAGLLDD